ncbi:MAG: tetratricopeptide repeat protein, partial [Deltaproteobacteria bacterium]
MNLLNFICRCLVFYILAISYFCPSIATAQNAEGITEQYRKALEMDPANMDARYLLGVALLREKGYKEAVTHLLKVYPSRAGEAEMNYNIGLAYTGSGDLQKAFQHYKKVDEVNAVEARDKFHLDTAFYNLGIAFQRAGNLDEALKAYQEAIQINPEQTSVYCTKGEILYQKKDYNAALDSLMTCRSKNPENKGVNRYISAINQTRGTEYLKQKNYAEARIELDKAITMDPTNETAYYYMGYLEYLDGNYRKSLSFLDKMKETEREDMKNALVSMLYNLGGALQKDQDWQGAVIAFSQAVNLRKDDSDLRFYLGFSYMKARDYDPAVAAFKETLRMDPKHQKAAINLAIVAEIAVKSHLRSGDYFLQNNSYNEALKDFNYVLSIDPNNQKGLEGREAAGKGIEKESREAAAKREREVSFKLQEAEKLITEGKYLMARKSFEAVIQLESANQKAREGINKTDELMVEAKKRRVEAGEKAFAAGQYYNAVVEYRLVLEYDPTDNTASENLAISLKRLSELISPLLSEARQHEDANRLPEALAAYNKIVDIQPDHKDALKEKTRVSDKLEKAFNEALSKGRENLKDGELIKAAENLSRALELKPDNEIAIEELSKISGKLKKIVDLRLADAASALKSGKYSEAVSNYKAALLIDRGSKEAALGLQNSTRLRDEAIEKRMSSGIKAYKEGVYYQAIAAFGEVLQIDRGKAEALK